MIIAPEDAVLLDDVLARYWGYSSFRPLQLEAIQAVLARRDSVVVLPTGGGKSLCFQAPALVREGMAVVVSPLISLMKDQVDTLAGNGVAAACYNSAMAAGEKSAVLQGVREGRYRLLYVSPERLVGEGHEWFTRLLAASHVSFAAIDEAHCISQWGHDFRPEYRQLARMRDVLPGVSLHAFTATATARVRHDIAVQLGLRDPVHLVGSFDRPNLTYRVLARSGLKAQLTAVLARHAGEAGIVYCTSRKEVDALAAWLASEGVRARPYHAGLDDEARHRNQDAFLNEDVDVVVATVAFGMGIDRSDVRFVAHAGAPRSLEHYQQESGRAGRDGLDAECVLFYSAADFLKWRLMLESSGELTDATRATLRDMERYAAAVSCRHRYLVEYFGERYARDGCGACDYCLGELEAAPEPIVLARKILSCVARVRQRFGAGHVISILRGQAADAIVSRGHATLSTFGLLRDASIAELRGYIEQLVSLGFLRQTDDGYPVLRLTPRGLELLRDAGSHPTLSLARQRVPSRRDAKANRLDRTRAGRPRHEGISWEGVDQELFEALRGVRLEIARERGVPPYVIFHDTTLREMARLKPHHEAELRAVYGVGERKAADLGARFLAAIAGQRSRQFNAQLPTPNVQRPTSNAQRPTPNCQLPTANCQLPSSNSQAPMTNSQLPTSSSQLLRIKDRGHPTTDSGSAMTDRGERIADRK
ncbi:MAG: DNA helicase RecQ [Vicinamibacterales bacterium]